MLWILQRTTVRLDLQANCQSRWRRLVQFISCKSVLQCKFLSVVFVDGDSLIRLPTDRQTRYEWETSILITASAENDLFQLYFYVNILIYSFVLNVPPTWIIHWTVKKFVRKLRLCQKTRSQQIVCFITIQVTFKISWKFLNSLSYTRTVPPLR